MNKKLKTKIIQCYQVRNVLETPGLLAVAVNGQWLLSQCLSNKIADNTTIVDTHAWAISVENSSNSHLKCHFKDNEIASFYDVVGQRKKDLNPSSSVVIHGQCLRCALPLIVAASNTDWVDVAPVGLNLGVL